jgi:hypothetical protein
MVYTDKEQTVKYLHIYNCGRYAHCQRIDIITERVIDCEIKRFKRGFKCLKYRGIKLYAMSEREK